LALRRKAALEEFAHRRGAARHPHLEAEIVQNVQFLRREHDLQPLTARLFLAHGFAPSSLN
jgi:hypothetical protein